MMNNISHRGYAVMRPARLALVLRLVLAAVSMMACSLFDPEPSEDDLAQFDRCNQVEDDGNQESAFDCFNNYYAGENPSVPDDEREQVIRDMLDCQRALGGENADAEGVRCDEELGRVIYGDDIDVSAQQTEEAAPILATVQAYETRAAAPDPVTAADPGPAPAAVPDPVTASVVLTWGERTDLDLAASPTDQMSWEFKPPGTLLEDDTVCPDITGREELLLEEPGLYHISVGVWSGCIIDEEQLPHFAAYTVEVQYSDGRITQTTGTIEGQIWQPVMQLQLP